MAGLGTAALGVCQAADPARILAELRATHLDPGRAVVLRDATIDLGAGQLVVESATVVPAVTLDGRAIELELSGSLRFRIEPPDEIEAAQLELFTGRRSLDVAVADVVLAVADPRLAQRLLDGPAHTADAQQLARAETTYRRWREGAERRRAGVEMSLLRALVGDSVAAGYVAAWCRTDELGEFFFEHDPEDPETLTLASFVPLDVRGWDRRRIARHIRFQQRKGRFLEARVEDLGAWDIWLSGPRDDTVERGATGPGFESRHYDIDVTVRRKRRLLDGHARVTVETLHAGRTTVPFEVHPDLRVREAHDASGAPLPFVQIGSQVVVVLPEAQPKGARFTIDLHYTGRALQWVGRGVHDLVDTDDWYPHTGAVDRATYELLLRWPKKQELLASGRLIEAGSDRRYRWERRRIDRPAIAASFVLGDLRVESRRIAGTELTLGFDHSTVSAERERAIATIATALEFLERTWGELPVDALTVVVLPRDYAQSYLGFVTLNRSMLESTGIETFGVGEWVRETTIAHELAHQWWGNLVGWSSYRDQWLSESMANYTALLYWAERSGRPDSPLGELAAGWRESLERLAPDGRTVESLGPVVLGHRLNSSKATGYQTVVYRKGAVVLAMLARAVGPERFHEALRRLLADQDGRTLTTADFLDELSRAAQIDLDGFARTFVYGTGIPDYYYTYDVTPADEHWIVRGEARRRSQVRPVVRIERDALERWDVVREFVLVSASEAAALRVPFRIVGRARPPSAAPESARATAVEGELMLHGDGRFEIETDLEPATFQLDPNGEVLASFAPADDPRRTLRLQAEDSLARGDLAAAEELLRRGLTALLGTPNEAGSARYRDAQARRDEGRLRAALVRLCLDQGRLEEARAEIAALEKILAQDRGALWYDREVLAARIDLASGAAQDAHRRLRRLLGRNEDDAPRVRADLAAEAWALLGVAAQAVGEAEDRDTALVAARSRGADVAAFAAAVAGQQR